MLGSAGRLLRNVPLEWMAVVLVWGLQCCVAVIQLLHLVRDRDGLGTIALWLLTLTGVVLLQTLHSAPAARRLRGAQVAATLTLQTVLTYVPALFAPSQWHAQGLGGFAAGSMLAVLRDRRGVAGFVLVLLCDGWAGWYGGLPAEDTAYSVFTTLALGLVVAAVIRLVCRLSAAQRAQTSAIRGALHEERLRIGRDMHDLLATRLTFAVLRGELAYRHIGPEDERARAELQEVLALTREALTDLRSLAHSFGDLSLRGELEHVRTLLTEMGLRVSVHDDVPLPAGDAECVFAVAVREAVTNLLRHSEATACSFTVYRKADEAVLSIVNDGCPLPPGPVPAARGHGLGNLAARAAGAGGSCVAWAAPDGWFHLRVTYPVKEPAGGPAAGPEKDHPNGQDRRTEPLPLR
ncbi:histidine kinase [Streptomyces sp. NPDC093085]|uniref:sensor histidine kinase n=1 Tax=Streptomyces sp. NPDC093085 TaxID=3155068 RepID=UPI00341892B0